MTRITQAARQHVLEKFKHHPPSGPEVIEGHERIRTNFAALAETLMDLLPDDPETRKALDKLDEAAMQANAAMARTQGLGQRKSGTAISW